EHAVASAFGVSREELLAPTRSRAPIAFARQVAMYLAHVGYSLTFTQIGELFSRDRTTVAHACSLIEDMRDDDTLDLTLSALENAIRTATQPSVA
ncbi:MAG: chromosomal replication initiator DnaA, partial [Chitinophagales bacterium]|nr:chromosomal replication initiator DnaA [Hyphomicrobiales bacterium]